MQVIQVSYSHPFGSRVQFILVRHFYQTEIKPYVFFRFFFAGDAGDSLAFANGIEFTTRDMDYDKSSWCNCAQQYKGAWWYESCHHSNLNGRYLRGSHKSHADGINWYHWKGYNYSLKKTEMKIRPRSS